MPGNPSKIATTESKSKRPARKILHIFVLLLLFASSPLADSLQAQGAGDQRSVASTFVALDSWVYPIFDRLAGMGFVRTGILGAKPWTRVECARLTEEASEILDKKLASHQNPDELSAGMVSRLEREFAYELKGLADEHNRSVALESVYARMISISGPPLTDGFHFGQTIDYDYGRNNRRGANLIAGAASRATYGPMAFYARAEYQHSPSAPALSTAVRNFIAFADAKSLEPAVRFEPVNRARLVEGYASLTLSNWQLLFGKKSLQWANRGMLFSNNAEPPWMINLQPVSPRKLPGFLGLLGPVHTQFFWSRLEGTTFVRHPNLFGTRISIKPHPRFELGFGHTVLLGGRNGSPLTPRTFFRSFLGLTTKPSNPGDARVSMDFAWRIPGSNLILYGEFFQDDEPAPFVHPGRAAIAPGLYWAQLPWMRKFDLRIESTSTEIYSSDINSGRLNYWNSQYRDGYVNQGMPLGPSVGRDGRQFQVSSSYALSPVDALQIRFRDSLVRGEYVPGGGAWQDYQVALRRESFGGLYWKGALQMERIRRFPLLFPGAKTNIALTVEVGYHGEARFGK